MKKHLKRIAASVSAICLAASFCSSMTASAALGFWPKTVMTQSANLWNSYKNATIHLDYCKSKDDYQDYLYNPGRNIRVVSVSHPDRYTISANKNDVQKLYGSDYYQSQAQQCALYHAEQTYDFLQNNGYNLGIQLYVAVNPYTTYTIDGSDGQRESAWGETDTVYFGMGSNNPNKENAVTFLGSASDVVTHEIMHLVTDKELGWSSYGNNTPERNALMEAYSDILAELADSQNDWKIGSTLFLHNSSTKNYCLRNIANPAATNNPVSPDENYCTTYQQFTAYVNANPYANNHAAVGSTVISHAAYLMHDMGFSNQTLAKIWLTSLSKYNKSTAANATFSDCKDAFFDAAVDVLGQTGNRYYMAQVFSLMEAFDEVGVY